MPKFAKPWFRPGRGVWYVTLNGKQVNLGSDRSKAFQEYARLIGEPRTREVRSGSLSSIVDAFSLLIEIHYRHYQFYANMFVATLIVYVCYRGTAPVSLGVGWLDLGVLILECVFFATSRDTLRKYYARTQQLLTAEFSKTRKDDSEEGTQAFFPESSVSSRPTKSSSVTPKCERIVRSWMMSKRRSPRSTLLTKDWVWPNRAAIST